MNSKKLFIILVTLVMILMMSACERNDEDNADNFKSVTFKVAVQEAQGQPVADMAERIKARIEEQSEGKINLDMFFAGQLGSYEAVYEEVQMGTIDIAIQSIPTQFDDRYNITCLPYSTTNTEQWKTLWLPNGAGYEKLSSYFEDNGIKLLSTIDYGFMALGFSNIKNGIDNVMDPKQKKDFLIRVPAMETYIKLSQEMGFNTTAIPYGDLYSALQTGVADGVIGCSTMPLWDSFRDVLKAVVDARYVCETGGCIINANKFNNLPIEYQDIILKVFTDESSSHADNMNSLEKDYLKKLSDYGVKVVYPSQEELNTMATHIQENVWPMYADLVGKNELDMLLNKIAEME